MNEEEKTLTPPFELDDRMEGIIDFIQEETKKYGIDCTICIMNKDTFKLGLRYGDRALEHTIELLPYRNDKFQYKLILNYISELVN